jgi:hypothetical protein
MTPKSLIFNFKFYKKLSSPEKEADSPFEIAQSNKYYFLRIMRDVITKLYSFNFKVNKEGICNVTRSANPVFFNKISMKLRDQFIIAHCNVGKINSIALGENNVFYKKIKKLGGGVYSSVIMYDNIRESSGNLNFDNIVNKLVEMGGYITATDNGEGDVRKIDITFRDEESGRSTRLGFVYDSVKCSLKCVVSSSPKHLIDEIYRKILMLNRLICDLEIHRMPANISSSLRAV